MTEATMAHAAEGATIIFGGSGFIGSHLIHKLLARQTGPIISVDIRPPKTTIAGVEYRLADVRDLSNFDVSEPVRRIVNLAAVHTTPGHETHEYYETNILGATHITAFARRKDVKEIIFTSSISVYGPSEESKSETTKPTPESSYGWSKWISEEVHRAWFEEDSSRKLVVCRPAVIFGKGEGGNFARMAKLLKSGFFIYPGRKDTIKACFYVEDLVDALIYAADHSDKYILLNGCYPDQYTLEEIVEGLRRKYFPKASTFLVPRGVVSLAAAALRPLSLLGLGIHPDRVQKLVRSTDVLPHWLEAEGQAAHGRLEHAIDRWAADTDQTFV